MAYKSNIKKLQKKAERLWKECVRLRDGEECQVKKHFPWIKTTHTEVYQVDHCFSRRYKRLFLEIANGTTVCSSCNLNKNYSDAIRLAIEDIVQARERELFDSMRQVVEQGGAFIEWRRIGWLEVKIQVLTEIRDYYKKEKDLRDRGAL